MRSQKQRTGVGLITGAASGIGRHLTGRLASCGYRILAADVHADGLEAAAREDAWPADRVVPHTLDVRRAEAWEEAFRAAEQHFGSIDLLLNVAGVLQPAWVTDITDEDVERMVDVNVKGVIHGTRIAARHMIPRGGGHIVNFGSLASLAPVPGLGVYAASKFAVRGFSLSAAVELRDRGVAVSLVMPDAVQTPMLDHQLDYEEAALTFSGPRSLTVEDIGRAVVERVLPQRPMELTLPPARGLLARLSGDLPAAARGVRPLLVRAGRRRQAQASKDRAPSR